MTKLFHIDFETGSECDIKLGITKYAMHPSTRIHCMSYALGSDDVTCIQNHGTMRDILYQYIADEDVFFVAHNASFERGVCTHILGVRIPINRWVCTAAMARHFGLPGSLSGASSALLMTVRKGDTATMMKLSKPLPENSWVRQHGGSAWHETPDRFIIPSGLSKPHQRKFEQYREADRALFAELYAYCNQDVEVERELYHRLPPLPPRERRLWALDAKINQRGIPVDLELASVCNRLSEEYVVGKIENLPVLTGGAVQTPKQVKELHTWLATQGLELPDLQAQTVRDALETDLAENVRAVLEIRQATAGNAHSKFSKFIQQAGPDQRVRDSYVFYGSHTGRWTSEGTQTNNIVRPEVKNAEIFAEAFKASKTVEEFRRVVVSDFRNELWTWSREREHDNKPRDFETFYRCVHNALVRPVICAEPGKTLIAIDYSAIEACGACWLAGAQHILDALFRGEKPYKTTASWIFDIPESEIEKGSFQYMLGKKIFLGGQYGIGADTFQSSCAREGLKIESTLAEKCVKRYQEKIPEIPRLWKEIDNAFASAMISDKPTWIRGKVLMSKEVFNGIVTLTLLLPSGRTLYYPQAEYKQTYRMVNEYEDGVKTGRKIEKLHWSFSYLGRLKNGGYSRVHSWGGEFTNNIVQAFCRDLLANTLIRVDALGICDIIMHVYDEIVVEVDEDKAEEVKTVIEGIMREGAPWATGMPLDCEGWIGKRYRK